MHLPLSRAVAGHIDVLDETGSTNAVLAARASGGGEPHFSVVMTTNQTAGRGRLGREWVAPPGRTIAVSVLLTPPAGAPQEGVAWLPLLAGLAMTRAVASLVPHRLVALKWPNDVQIDGLKVSGLLAELVPGAGVVIGAGLNLTMAADELPTPTSTSLTLEGAQGEGIVDAALAAYLGELTALYSSFVDSGMDALASGLHAAATRACSTLGRTVRVELPGGDQLIARADSLDDQGRLVVLDPATGRSRHVAAGDVTHVRYP